MDETIIYSLGGCWFCYERKWYILSYPVFTGFDDGISYYNVESLEYIERERSGGRGSVERYTSHHCRKILLKSSQGPVLVLNFTYGEKNTPDANAYNLTLDGNHMVLENCSLGGKYTFERIHAIATRR